MYSSSTFNNLFILMNFWIFSGGIFFYSHFLAELDTGFTTINRGDNVTKEERTNVVELEYYVYLPDGGTVDLKAIEWEDREYQATWVNGKNTKDIRQGGRTSNGRNLSAPDKEDWILHLTIADNVNEK